jgi:uncharacterized membrane protein YjfL (UPF0719 family)
MFVNGGRCLRIDNFSAPHKLRAFPNFFMKTSQKLFALTLILSGALAASAEPTLPLPALSWHAQTLVQAVANMLVFAFIGLGVAVLGYKIFDKCTPGDLTKEIIENKNVAAAIIGAAVILGVCVIVAAAMIG